MDLNQKQLDFNNKFMNHVKNFINRIKNLLEQNKISLIIQILKKEIKIFNNNPFAINLYSHIILTYKPNFEWIDYCHEILLKIYSIFPEDIFTLYNLGLFNIFNDKYQNALEFFNIIDNLKSNDINIHFNISYCLEKMGSEKSIQAYLEIIQNTWNKIKNENFEKNSEFNKSFYSFINYSNILAKNGKYNYAEALLEKYFKFYNKNNKINNNLMLNKYYQNKLPLEDYEKNITISKTPKETDWTLKFNLSIFKYKQKLYDDSIEILKNIFNNCENKNLTLLSGINLGKIYEEINKDELAIEIYKKIVSKFKNYINLTDIVNKIDELYKKNNKILEKSMNSYVKSESESLNDIINFDIEKSMNENDIDEEFIILKNELFNDLDTIVNDLNNTSYYKSLVDENENVKNNFNKIKSERINNNLNNSGFETNSIEIKISKKGKNYMNFDSNDKGINLNNSIDFKKKKKKKYKKTIIARNKNLIKKNSKSLINIKDDKIDIENDNKQKNEIIKNNDLLISEFLEDIYDFAIKGNEHIKIEEEKLDKEKMDKKNKLDEEEFKKEILTLENLNIFEIKNKLEKDPSNFALNYQLAMLSLYNDDVDLFKKNLIKIHKLNPQFKQDIINKTLGDLFFKEQNYSKSLYFYSNIYNKDSDNNKIKFKIVKCFYKLNKLDPAIKILKELKENDKSNIKIIYLLGKIFFLKENYIKSKEYFLNVLKFEENNYKCFIKLAEINFKEKIVNFETIKKFWEKAIIIGIPNNKDIIKCYKLLSKTFVNLNKVDWAIEYLNKILNIKPNHIEIRKELANLYLKNNNHKLAIKEYKKILNIDKENIEICNIIGTIYALDRNFVKAIKYLKYVDNLDPGNFEANIKLAKIYRDTIDDFRNAKVYFNKILKKDNNNYKLYYELAITELKLNNEVECIKNMKKCLKINSEFTNGYLFLGDIFYNKKNYDSSLKFYQKAKELEVENINANEGIIKCYYNNKNYIECKSFFRNVSHLNFKDNNIFLILADCYINLDRLNDAKEFLEKSIANGIINMKIQKKLAKIYLKLKLYEQSKEIYLDLIELDKSNYLYYKNIGNIYSIERKFELALEYYKQAFELNNEIQIHYWLALVYLELGDYQQSKVLYEEIIKIEPHNPKARIKLGYLYTKFGSNQLALIEYERAYRLNPNDKLKDIIIRLKNKIFAF